MLTKDQRTTIILELYEKGLGTREIQNALMLSRGAIKRVISTKIPDPPHQQRRR